MDVASITIVLRDMSDYAAVNEGYIEHFSKPNPPSRQVVVLSRRPIYYFLGEERFIQFIVWFQHFPEFVAWNAETSLVNRACVASQDSRYAVSLSGIGFKASSDQGAFHFQCQTVNASVQSKSKFPYPTLVGECIYRVAHHLVDITFVDFFPEFRHGVDVFCQFCTICSCPSRIGQTHATFTIGSTELALMETDLKQFFD